MTDEDKKKVVAYSQYLKELGMNPVKATFSNNVPLVLTDDTLGGEEDAGNT